MTKPVTIPNTFATATTAIPLSQLDSDFSTVATALNDANTYSNYAADTGVANAYVVTLTGVSTTYSAGLRIQFKAGAANTGASTLNVNSGGTKNITFQDASALSSGTIAANAIVDVMYDGTQFLLMNDPAGTVGTGDVVGPAGATDNAIVRFDGATGKLVQNSVVTIADSTGDMSGVGALTATGNVSFDGGTFVFNESGADKDFRIEGDTEPNLFFTDASTDRVGIGTSSPATTLHVKSAVNDSTNGLTLEYNAGTAYYQRLYSSGNDLFISADTGNTGGTMRFLTGGSERARITSGGNLDLQKNLGLGGTSATTSGTGITFPATQSASTDANTLDDYEEGTWTPVVSDATTGGNLATLSADSNGVYTKIGNIVYWRFSVILTSKGSMVAGQEVYIQGFPFQSAVVTGSWYNPFPAIIRNVTFTGYVQFNQVGNTTYGYLRENVSNANGDNIIVSDITDSAAMQVSGFYRVA